MSDVHGPIDFLILEFGPRTVGDATTQALTDLVDQGVVRLYDLMPVQKDPDGSCREVELTGALATFAGARSGLLGADDLREAANALEPGARGLVILYENRWAAPFVTAARADGVEMVASARLTAPEIMEALEVAEATN
jgi:hypothetical protein